MCILRSYCNQATICPLLKLFFRSSRPHWQSSSTDPTTVCVYTGILLSAFNVHTKWVWASVLMCRQFTLCLSVTWYTAIVSSASVVVDDHHHHAPSLFLSVKLHKYNSSCESPEVSNSISTNQGGDSH